MTPRRETRRADGIGRRRAPDQEPDPTDRVKNEPPWNVAAHRTRERWHVMVQWLAPGRLHRVEHAFEIPVADADDADALWTELVVAAARAGFALPVEPDAVLGPPRKARGGDLFWGRDLP